MARTKVSKVSNIRSVEEADAALMRLGQIQREINRNEGSLNQQIESAKARAAEKSAPLIAERKGLEADLEAFAVQHRDLFGERQSLTLSFGVLSFRRSRKLVIRSVQNTLAAIQRIFGDKKDKYLLVRTKMDIDKEALEKLADEDLAPLGVTRKEKEEFGYELDWEKIV